MTIWELHRVVSNAEELLRNHTLNGRRPAKIDPFKAAKIRRVLTRARSEIERRRFVALNNNEG